MEHVHMVVERILSQNVYVWFSEVYLSPQVDFEEIDIFTASFVGQPKDGVEIWIWKDEKAKIPPIKQRPTLRLWMNGKLIPKPVGYSPIWPEGSGIKEYGRNTKVLNKQMKCRLAGKIAGSKKVIGFPKTTIWRGQRLRWWWCILVYGVWWP